MATQRAVKKEQSKSRSKQYPENDVCIVTPQDYVHVKIF